MLKPKPGRLLISTPIFDDSFFFKSVILLTHHNKNESIGLILNKPSNIYLSKLNKSIKCDNFKVYIGGPVERDSLFYIHTIKNYVPGSIKITKNVSFGGDFNFILELLNTNKITPKQIKFFKGYSGWSQNQLNNEIKNGSWIVNNIDLNDSKYISESNNNLWKNLIKKGEEKYAIWSNMPANPNMN